MSKLFNFVQHVWQKAEWGASPFVERAILPRLYELEEWALPYLQPHLPVTQLRGQGKAGLLTATFIGLDYGRWYLKRTMFAQEPTEIAQPPISVRHPDAITRIADSDIVVVAGSEKLIRQLPRQNALVLPLYVEHILDIQGNWDEIEKRLRQSKSFREDLRLVRKYGYTYKVSHDPKDLETHYHDFYLPTMNKRHGEEALIVSMEEAREHLRRGCLFIAKRDGKNVASVVCRTQAHKVTLISVGVAEGNEQWIKEGAMGALYIWLFQWANQAGYKAVDFLGGPPYLGMGIFQFKRKYGTNGGIPPHLHKRVWIKIQRDTPAVRQFLIDTPCAVIRADGNLDGLVVVDDCAHITPEIKERFYKQYHTPAMRDLIIQPVGEFFGGNGYGQSIPDR